MTDIYGPFDTSTWSQTEWARHMLPAMPSGVIDVPAASVSAGGLALLTSGLNVGLDQGRANVGGFGFWRTGVQTANITVAANGNSTLYRRDRLVLRRSLSTSTVTPVRIQGTAAATPVNPGLTRTDTVWDLPMFSFLVPPSSGTILSGLVDERIWLSPEGDAGSLGLLGHQIAGTGNVGTSSSTTPVELKNDGSLRFSCYLRAGRAYEYTSRLRGWSSVAADVISAAARLTPAVVTPSGSDPQITGDVVTAETAGVVHLYPLTLSKVFQVAVDGRYTFSLWGNRVTGSGTATYLHTSDGSLSHQVKDVGVALPTVPFPS